MELPLASSLDHSAMRVNAAPARDRRVRTDEQVPLPRGDGGFVDRRSSGRVQDRRQAPAAGFAPRERSEIVNRVTNVLIASLALLIVAPVMLLVALAVRLTSRGPVLYKQTRVGIDRRARSTRAMYDRRSGNTGGKVFTIYKFRSMRVDAEAGTGAVWAQKNDPRVTPIGKFLRASRLDELPQLFNVVLGDMNIVGPRPERPSLFAQLSENITEYPLRQRTKPGITGLAQISQPYDSCLDDVRRKVHYDLQYLQRQSLAEDIRIMLKTVPVMLFRKGGW